MTALTVNPQAPLPPRVVDLAEIFQGYSIQDDLTGTSGRVFVDDYFGEEGRETESQSEVAKDVPALCLHGTSIRSKSFPSTFLL